MTITVNIDKNSSKIFFSENRRCHDEKYEATRRDTQTSPGLRGEKIKRDCREQSVVAADEQVMDLETSEGRDSKEIWRRSRGVQIAADAWLRPRKRGTFEETEGEKILRGGAGVSRFRSGVKTRVKKRRRDRGYL